MAVGAAPTWDERFRRLAEAAGATSRERELLEADMVSIEVHGTSPAHQGANRTHKVELDIRSGAGRIAFFKSAVGQDPSLARRYRHAPRDVPLNEAIAWRLAHALGEPFDELVPTCVVRELEVPRGGIWARLSRRRRVQPGALIDRKRGKPLWDEVVDETDLVDHAAFWDALVGQQDRHTSQFRYRAGRLGLIDHGYAFARSGDPLNATAFLRERLNEGRGRLRPEELDVLDRLLESGDLCGIDAFLPAGRADAFEQRARRMMSGRRLLPPGEF